MKTKLNLLAAAVFLVTAGSAGAAVRYVDGNSTNATPPYTNWATAAATIQAAVDAADAGDEIVVTNGIYATGGRAVVGTMTNRVAVDKPLTVRSVNGPAVTVIQGYQVPGASNGDGAVRCVYLTNGASLSGFTLMQGATRSAGDWREQSGGGLWCEATNVLVSNCVLAGNSAARWGGGAGEGALTNCVLTGNWAGWYGGGAGYGTLVNCTLSNNWAGSGGGVCNSTLNNCTLSGNRAVAWGGGAVGGAAAWSSTLSNCTLTGNFADFGGGVGSYSALNNCTLTGNYATNEGGGAFMAMLNNCIIHFNTAAAGPNHGGSTLNYCCTTPDPGGLGNITNAPLFVDYAGGNLRLQSNSPCINAGFNAYAAGTTDLDGHPRIVHGTVDLGAYEFQGPGSAISYAWLQQYDLATDGSADYADPDGDGMNNWQEWRCGTDPRNAASVLRLLSAPPAGSNVTVTWQSVSGMSYFLERSTNLAVSPPFTMLATNLPGQAGTTSFTDTNAAAARRFYRVGVP